MKVTVYMAISANGYIAELDGTTSWVSESDWDQLKIYIKSSDAVVMGKHTYEVSEKDGDFPYGDILNVVLTSQPAVYSAQNKTLFTNSSPKDLINNLKEKGMQNVLLIGGGITNARFMNDGLVDEIVLSVHPIILGKGIKVFNDFEKNINLTLTETKSLAEGLVHLVYDVNK